MKIFNKLAIIAAGITMSFGMLQPEARAASFNQIIDIDAKLNTRNNLVSLMLSAGTYGVDYIGMNDGGAYDGWNAWGRVSGCNSNGENCTNGWLNSYVISFKNFSQIVTSNNRYSNSFIATQNAVNLSFTLPSDMMVNFFIPDSVYEDNVGGISLKLSSQSVPEPSSMLGLLAIGTLGISTLKLKKQLV